MNGPGAVDTRLAEIEQREQVATPGPWEMFRYGNGGGRIHLSERTLIADMEGDPDQVATVYNEGDREFLFSAREDVPWLLSQLRDARAENAELVESLDRIAAERDAFREERNEAQAENEQWQARLTEHADCDLRNAAELRKLHAEVERLRERADHNAAAVNANADMIIDLRTRLAAAEAKLAAVREQASRDAGTLALIRQVILEGRVPPGHIPYPRIVQILHDAALAAAEQDELPRCEHGFTDAHAVIETSFAPPPHPTCPGPVSQHTEGAAE